VDRSREIYERIIDAGLAAIEQFIADRKFEELFLDFKRAANNGKDTKLTDSDRKILAKAISGFGNSEGGVIVWGVDCSRDVDGADVAKAFVPVENPRRFASLLQGVLSGCTVPPHPHVENHVLETGANVGFVVTHVPKSNYAPHQMLPNRTYYIRAGSDFLPTPHDVLSGMFGRRPQPHVFHQFISAVPRLDGEELKLTFGVAVHNEGPGIASDIFALCRIEALPGPNCGVQFERGDELNWAGAWEFGQQTSLISKPEFRLPPGANAQPVIVHLLILPPFDGSLKISGTVGAGTSVPYHFTIATDSGVVKASYSEFRDQSAKRGLTTEEKHRIGERILREERQNDG